MQSKSIIFKIHFRSIILYSWKLSESNFISEIKSNIFYDSKPFSKAVEMMMGNSKRYILIFYNNLYILKFNFYDRLAKFRYLMFVFFFFVGWWNKNDKINGKFLNLYQKIINDMLFYKWMFVTKHLCLILYILL